MILETNIELADILDLVTGTSRVKLEQLFDMVSERLE